MHADLLDLVHRVYSWVYLFQWWSSGFMLRHWSVYSSASVITLLILRHCHIAPYIYCFIVIHDPHSWDEWRSLLDNAIQYQLLNWSVRSGHPELSHPGLTPAWFATTLLPEFFFLCLCQAPRSCTRFILDLLAIKEVNVCDWSQVSRNSLGETKWIEEINTERLKNTGNTNFFKIADILLFDLSQSLNDILVEFRIYSPGFKYR